GEGPLRSTQERQIWALGLADRVSLMGSRPHAELPTWFRVASVLALPSHSEGVPNVLLEASACGTPFVASHVGGIPEVAHLGDGRTVPPGDAMALAAAIEASLNGRGRADVARQHRSYRDSAQELVGVLEEARQEFHATKSRDALSGVPMIGRQV